MHMIHKCKKIVSTYIQVDLLSSCLCVYFTIRGDWKVGGICAFDMLQPAAEYGSRCQ